MLMNSLVVGAALAAVVSGSALAETSKPDLADFRRSAEHLAAMGDIIQDVGNEGTLWIELLPYIEQDCIISVNRKTLLQTTRQFGWMWNETVKQQLASRKSSGDIKNDLIDAWKVMTNYDKDGACKIAKGLWGDFGEQIPGIFTTDD